MASSSASGVRKKEAMQQILKHMEDVLGSDCIPNDPHAITQLLDGIDQTLKGHGVVDNSVPVSKGVENLASYLEKHLSEVISIVQLSKDLINALGNLPWAGVGLTIIAMGLNMTLKTVGNRETCIDIITESLELWKKVMLPVLETRGPASDLMRESTRVIVEGLFYCIKLLNSRTWKRFIRAIHHEGELKKWKEKRTSLLSKATAVISAETLKNLSPLVPPLSKTSATTLVGLEERKKHVLKLLKLEGMDEIRVVVLHGMGGVGKSTLAEAVYNQAASAMLGRRIYCRTEVGKKPSKLHITSLQRKMVEDLTGESLRNMERDEAAIKDKWRQVLLSEGGEPLLIYIDNVLQREDLENIFDLDCELIRIPKGSRLLVTTRDMSVCNRVFQRNQHFNIEEFNVKVLNEKDAERLFFLHAFGKEEPSTELVEKFDDGEGLIKKMVSSICGNLPLALRVLGRSLYNENISFWRKKCNKLTTKLSQDSEFEEKVTNVLRSSYITLDSETQIAFLIACVCFSGRTVMGFRDCVTSLLPKATGKRLFEVGLLEREYKLFYGGGNFRIKIHDLIRNLGYELAAKRKWAYPTLLTSKEDFSDVKDEFWSVVKWLEVPPLEDGIDAELLEKCKKLEILFLNTRVNGHIRNPPQHLKAVYNNASVSIDLDKLKELVVWRETGHHQEELPVTSSLQVFLGFRGPHISDDIVDCHKNTLRKLSCGGIVKLSSYFFEKMNALQWLYLHDYEGDNFPEEIGTLVGLKGLCVESTTIQEIPESLARLTRLERLSLELQNLKEVQSGVLWYAKTEVLWMLVNLGGVKSMPMQDIGQLASLEVLYLDLPSMERPMVEGGVSPEKLRWLELKSESMSSLEGVCLRCPSLECVVLALRNLKVLPSTFITGATKLRSVKLQQCDCLQGLPAGAEMLGAVESLLVWDCPALKALPEGLTRLQRLGVVGCGGLGGLPGDVVERAGGMRLLLCDARLLRSLLLPLPWVLPFTPGDWRAEQGLESFIIAEFSPPPSANWSD